MTVDFKLYAEIKLGEISTAQDWGSQSVAYEAFYHLGYNAV